VTGSLHWADPADLARTAALHEMARQMIGWGTRVDTLTPEEARGLEPDLAIDDAVREVMRVDRAAWVETVPMITATITTAIRRYGARFVRGEVATLRNAGGLIEAVELADGTVLPADLVVNAAGADASRLVASAGAGIPIERNPGLLVSTQPLAASLDHVVYAPWANLRPDGGNRVMVQVEPLDIEVHDGELVEPDDGRVVRLFESAIRVMPALRDAVVASVIVGVRALPVDGHPIVGFDEHVANLYHVVTHSGITLAARLALLVTEDLTGGDPTPLEPYRPSRFRAGRTVPPVPAIHG
jgi:glycine/D-amino acid oxidase-like deaminating enzyme